MGILDDLREKLTTTVVETEIPAGTKSSMDLLAERLSKSEDLEAFSAGPEKIVRPDRLAPGPVVGPSLPAPSGYVGPAEEATLAKKRAQFEAGPMIGPYRGGMPAEALPTMPLPPGPMIGPYRPEQYGGINEQSLVPPEVTSGMIMGQAEAQRLEERWGPDGITQALKLIAKFGSSAALAEARTFNNISTLIDQAATSVGLEPQGVFAGLTNILEDAAQLHGATAKGGAIPLNEIAGALAGAAGQMAWDLPLIKTLGPHGFSLFLGLNGLAENGAEGMVEGLAQGALIHKIFYGLGYLKPGAQMPAAFAVGAGTSMAGGGTLQDALAEGMIWGGMSAGGKGKGVRLQDTIDAYTSLSEAQGRAMLRRIDPNIDLGEIHSAGGAKALIKRVTDAAAAERAARDKPFRDAMKLDKARRDIVGKMSDAELTRRHLEYRIKGPEGTSPEEDAKWLPAMEAEMAKRLMKPIETGKEYVEKKYTRQELDEILGRIAPEDKSGIADVIRKETDIDIDRGEAFTFNNGIVLKLDANGQPIVSSRKPMGEKMLNDIASGKVPLPDDLVRPPLERVLARDRRTGAQTFVDRPMSAAERVEKLMLMVPHMKPETTRNGYTRVLAPGHPFADEYGRVALHRLVWEQHNGKLAAPWEDIHHKNETPSDNRPENLELKPTREAHLIEHAGRVPTEAERTYPFEMADRRAGTARTPGERAETFAELDEATRMAGLGEKFEDVQIAPRVKRGRKPGDIEPMGPEELASLGAKTLGTATPAFRDPATGAVYPGQPGESTHAQMFIRLQDQGVDVNNMISGWIEGDGTFATSTEVQMQRSARALAAPAAAAPAPPPEPLRGKRSSSYIKAVASRHLEPATKSHVENGGSTFNPTRGDMAGSDTFAVSPYPLRQRTFPGKEIPPGELERYWKDNADLIATDDRLGVGTWFNEKTKDNPEGDNLTYLDISATFPKDKNGKAAAEYLGRKYDQKGITHLDPDYKFPYYPTGGTGGKNIDPSWLPDAKRLSDPELLRILKERPGEPPAGSAPGDPNMVAKPGAPVEDYSKSKVLDKGDKLGIVSPEAGDAAAVVDRLRFLLFDKFSPIHDLVKRLQESGIDVPLMRNPSYMVKLLGGLSGRAETKVFYKRFTTDKNGQIVFSGKSLKDIYDPHRGDMPGFDDFLLSRRALEIDRNNAGKDPKDQIDVGMDLALAKQVVQAGQAKYGGSAKEFTSYFHGLLDELASSGLVEKKVISKWKAESPEYAPMRVDMEKLADMIDNASGSTSARQMLDKVMSPIKKLRGSKDQKLPPTQAAVAMTYEITSAVERNLAARAIVDLRLLSPEMGNEIIEVAAPVQMVKPLGQEQRVPIRGKQGKDMVSVSVDGVRKYYEVPSDIAESMKMIYDHGMNRWVKLMALPARWLRTGATAAPEFALRNPLRDWLNAYVNAKKGFNPITDFSRGLFEMITRPEEYWKWKAAGGEWSMMVTLDREIGTDAIKRMTAEESTGIAGLKKYVKTPLGYLEKVSEMGEKPTRLGVFGKARMKGLSDIEAAVESREASTDFAVRGAETKSMSAMYTFLNARAQTTLKLARTAKEDPIRFTIRGMAAAGIPSAVLYAINRDDPEYWKRDQFERDMFWLLPFNIAGRQVKVPKGEVGVLFGTSVERILQALDSKAETKPQVTKFLQTLMQSASPVGNPGELLPTFARPIAEWVNNKSYYYGTPLESEADEAVAPYLRYKPGTSETMKSLGQSLGVFNKGAGVSPIKMENTLRGLTGGVGRHTLRAVDWAADKLGLTETGPRPSDPMNIPGLAGFVSRRAVGFESEPAKSFYEMADSLDMTEQTLKELVKQGPVRAREIKQWMDDHWKELEMLKRSKIQDPDSGATINLVKQTRTKLADLRKMQNLIAERKDLTGKQKREALDKIDKSVSDLVDPLWKLLNAVTSQKKR